MQKRAFSPLIFLASLGAGGISVIPFAFFQYTEHTGKGLINISQIDHAALPFLKQVLFYSLESMMVVFAIIHLVTTFIFIKGLIQWVRSEEYSGFIQDPLKNAGVLAPFISITMTMNVFIGPVRFFVIPMAENLQVMMLPALIGWAIIWVLLLRMVIKLLTISFEKSFDVSKINFGWLLHPFALGMVTVTGTGIAAMAKSANIAHTAAFMSLVTGSMGVFLLVVKLISLFKSHFAAEGLPEKQFLPSFLIIVPNITLYAISFFRMGHYFEHQWGAHLGSYFTIVITGAFAFETWYLLFGISLLRNYIKKHFFKKEFYVSQWGLVCPFVAYSVLGGFLYKLFIPNPFTYGLVIVTTIFTVALFGILMYRQLSCAGIINTELVEIDCAGGPQTISENI
jgi:hypothetical protein